MRSKRISIFILFISYLCNAEAPLTIWDPFNSVTSEKVYEILKSLPNPSLEFEKKLGTADDPSKPHDWLDPKIVNWGAGEFSVFCRIEVTHHGTKANLKKSTCNVKNAKANIVFTGADAATIYKRLMNPKNYWGVENYSGGQTIKYNLGPITLLVSQTAKEKPIASLVKNEDFVAEKNSDHLGLSGTGR